LSGKTRAVYEALVKLNKPFSVLAAINTDIYLEKFSFPKHFKFWRSKILFIDDLQRLVELQNFEHLFKEAMNHSTSIIATCRSGIGCKKAKNKMAAINLDFETIFKGNIVELGKVPQAVAEDVAKQAGIDWAKVKFDGNIGSVFMKLSEMEKRFNDCEPEEQAILRALRKLYVCGIYRDNQVFPLEWIKIAGKSDELEGKKPQWMKWLEDLKAMEFLIWEKDQIQAEQVYLEEVVRPDVNLSSLEIFEQMIRHFSGVPEVLIRLGSRAYAIGEPVVEKLNYMQIAINAYQESLRFYIFDSFPILYAKIQNALGNAYAAPAEVEDKTENCKKAIKAYQEALKVHTFDRFPENYARTQISLGSAYAILAHVEHKLENCLKSIEASQESLKVYTLDRFPIDYALAQNNLGSTYGILAQVEDKLDNSRRAIQYFQEALKVRTLNRAPKDYAMTQNNIGNAYGTLAQVEDKPGNCQRAINAFQEALKVYTLDRFPIDYAMTNNNLGAVYHTISEVENKSDNCLRAIKAYKEALKVFTIDHFPMDYAMTQNNLGNAYRTLAETEDKTENCQRAKKAYNEALKVYTEKQFPQVRHLIQNNLTNLLQFCNEK
jgi:tetratricopeptide (TPR) repeat protein